MEISQQEGWAKKPFPAILESMNPQKTIGQKKTGKTLVLDFGQVLTINQNREVYTPLLKELNREPEDFFHHWAIHRLPYDEGILDTTDYWEKVLLGLGVKNASVLAEQRRQEFLAIDIKSFNNPRNNLINLVKDLSSRGLNTAILSNMPPEVGQHWEALWPWLSMIRYKFWSGDVQMVKPNRNFYALVMDQTGAHPEDILFIDDLAQNIETAVALGWNTHHFTDEQQCITAIREWTTNGGSDL